MCRYVTIDSRERGFLVPPPLHVDIVPRHAGYASALRECFRTRVAMLISDRTNDGGNQPLTAAA